MKNNAIKIVLWDYGGVLTESPIKNFQKFENENNYVLNTIVKINSNNKYQNAERTNRFLRIWCQCNTPGHAKCVNAIGKVKYCSKHTKQINSLSQYSSFRVCKAV